MNVSALLPFPGKKWLHFCIQRYNDAPIQHAGFWPLLPYLKTFITQEKYFYKMPFTA